MFELRSCSIPDVVELFPVVHRDVRGQFSKIFHEKFFRKSGLRTDWREMYYSTSRANVVRGLHFQLPPNDHAKMVVCLAGEVVDAIVDLRVGSPTYAQSSLFRLSSEVGNAIYIPSGFAHGFCVQRGLATLLYLTTSVHVPESDTGIAWNSVDIKWPLKNPVLSERDAQLPPLAGFTSPFRYITGPKVSK